MTELEFRPADFPPLSVFEARVPALKKRVLEEISVERTFKDLFFFVFRRSFAVPLLMCVFLGVMSGLSDAGMSFASAAADASEPYVTLDLMEEYDDE